MLEKANHLKSQEFMKLGREYKFEKFSNKEEFTFDSECQ